MAARKVLTRVVNLAAAKALMKVAKMAAKLVDWLAGLSANSTVQ